MRVVGVCVRVCQEVSKDTRQTDKTDRVAGYPMQLLRVSTYERTSISSPFVKELVLTCKAGLQTLALTLIKKIEWVRSSASRSLKANLSRRLKIKQTSRSSNMANCEIKGILNVTKNKTKKVQCFSSLRHDFVSMTYLEKGGLGLQSSHGIKILVRPRTGK